MLYYFLILIRPLEGVQSCLQTLRDQMSELQHQANNDQSISSSTWKYKLGFHCEKCEMKWEVEHQVKDNSGKDNRGEEFLESPITQNVPRCNCYKMYQSDNVNKEIDYSTEDESINK